jgi:hypothetical protein
MNDIAGLFLYYYSSHILIFVLFTFLIFITTLICINIGIIAKINTQQSIEPFKDIFLFLKDIISFNFKRNQNMNYQQKKKSTTRFVNLSKVIPVETTEE